MKQGRFLAVSLGNTNCSCALFRGGQIVARVRLRLCEGYRRALERFLALRQIDACWLCSVVPEQTREVSGIIRARCGIPVKVLDRLDVPMRTRYRVPAHLGLDRLLASYAAYRLYGGPLIVVDCGTALTLNCVGAKGIFLGGLIVPGLALLPRCLAEAIPRLPAVSMRGPFDLIAADTDPAIRSGCFLGFAALIDGLCARLKKRLGRKVRVIATGGAAQAVRPYCASFDRVDPDLGLKGMHFVFAADIPGDNTRNTRSAGRGEGTK